MRDVHERRSLHGSVVDGDGACRTMRAPVPRRMRVRRRATAPAHRVHRERPGINRAPPEWTAIGKETVVSFTTMFSPVIIATVAVGIVLAALIIHSTSRINSATDNSRTGPATREDVANLRSQFQLAFGVLIALHLIVLSVIAATLL